MKSEYVSGTCSPRRLPATVPQTAHSHQQNFPVCRVVLKLVWRSRLHNWLIKSKKTHMKDLFLHHCVIINSPTGAAVSCCYPNMVTITEKRELPEHNLSGSSYNLVIIVFDVVPKGEKICGMDSYIYYIKIYFFLKKKLLKSFLFYKDCWNFVFGLQNPVFKMIHFCFNIIILSEMSFLK